MRCGRERIFEMVLCALNEGLQKVMVSGYLKRRVRDCKLHLSTISRVELSSEGSLRSKHSLLPMQNRCTNFPYNLHHIHIVINLHPSTTYSWVPYLQTLPATDVHVPDGDEAHACASSDLPSCVAVLHRSCRL